MIKLSTYFFWNFMRKEMMDDLSKIGLTQRKSLTMQFPMVPENHKRHFIRGCWDGDGGFSVNPMSPMGHYTCGSKEFIEKIVDELYQVGIVRRQIDKASHEERLFCGKNILWALILSPYISGKTATHMTSESPEKKIYKHYFIIFMTI